MATSAIFGERYLSKIGAVFDSECLARKAAREVMVQTAVRADQISFVRPHDNHVGRKLEPENLGIAATLVKSHLALGVAGAAIGIVAACLLVFGRIPPFSAAPYYTFGVTLFLGLTAGLLLGGLFALRPDHVGLITRIQDAARAGRWALVVHVRNEDEKANVGKILEHWDEEVTRTL